MINRIMKNSGNKAYIKDYGVRPLVAHVESKINGSTVYFLEDYTQAKSFLNDIRKRDSSFSYEYCEELCEKIIGKDLWRK